MKPFHDEVPITIMPEYDYEWTILIVYPKGEEIVVVSAPDDENAVQVSLEHFFEVHPEYGTDHEYPVILGMVPLDYP